MSNFNLDKFRKAWRKHTPPCESFMCQLRSVCAKHRLACAAFAKFTEGKKGKAPEFTKEYPDRETFDLIYKDHD